MNILYDFSVVGPFSGGLTTVCRFFAFYFTKEYPDNTYYAVTSDSLVPPLVSLSNPVSNLEMLDKLLAKDCTGDEPVKNNGLLNRTYHSVGWMWPLRIAWRSIMAHRRTIQSRIKEKQEVRASHGFSNNCKDVSIDVIHCPFQWIRPLPSRHLKKIPYIMNLHDLQHEHYPEFFTNDELNFRRRVWYTSAKVSRFVVAAADHVKEDIIKYTGIPEERVPVIPWGVPFDDEPDTSDSILRSVRKKYDLPERFIFYPAVTWKHKNHIGLLKAIDMLKSKGIIINLILTGGKGSFNDQVMSFILDNDLSSQVSHLGFVPFPDMKALYKLAEGTVVPSLYEQSSGPVMEAIALKCPVAAGRIADLPELLANNCGFLFDPEDFKDIANSLQSLWEQRIESMDMAVKAYKQIHSIRSWKSWANSYNELYNICRDEKMRRHDL